MVNIFKCFNATYFKKCFQNFVIHECFFVLCVTVLTSKTVIVPRYIIGINDAMPSYHIALKTMTTIMEMYQSKFLCKTLVTAFILLFKSNF